MASSSTSWQRPLWAVAVVLLVLATACTGSRRKDLATVDGLLNEIKWEKGELYGSAGMAPCATICGHSRTLCGHTEEICAIEDRHADDDEFDKACAAAQSDCRLGEVRCNGCKAEPKP